LIKKLVFAVFILVFTCFIVFFTFKQQLDKPLNIKEAQLLTIEKGSSLSFLLNQLVSNSWIDNKFWIRNYVRVFPKSVVIKAGTYLIQPNSTSLTLLAQISSGIEHQFSITFIEGSTFKDWLILLKQQPYLKQTLTNKSVADIALILDLKHENPEGLFFPETYAYTANTKDISLLIRANQKMQQKIDSLWKTRMSGLPYESKYEALIMASIIEKETSYLPEQPLIASVFVNRLNKKMRLQTDPTIIYGLGDRYQGDITYAHKREKTAYNTYRISGLPPTPIAMPGLSSIKAALNPDQSDYFYFVSNGDKKGNHKFSKTLAEHNAAVQRYLKKIRSQ